MTRRIVLCCLVLAAAPLHAEERVRAAFVGVNPGDGISDKAVGTLEELILGALQSSERFDVLSRRDVAQMLDQEQQKQFAGCDAASCMAEIVGAMGVTSFLSADAGKLGPVTVLSLKLIDSKLAKVRVRVTRKIKDDSELADSAEAIVTDLLQTLDGKPGAAPRREAAPAPTPTSEPASASEVQRTDPHITLAAPKAEPASAVVKPAPADEPTPAARTMLPASAAATDPVRDDSLARLAAVLPPSFTQAGVDDPTQLALTESLRTGVAPALAAVGYTVLTEETTLGLLQDNGIDPTRVCEASCALEAAREMKARYIVATTVVKSEGVFIAYVRLFDSADGRIVNTVKSESASIQDVRRSLETIGGPLVAPLVVPDSPGLRAAGWLSLGVGVVTGLAAAYLAYDGGSEYYAAFDRANDRASYDSHWAKADTQLGRARIAGAVAAGTALLGLVLRGLAAP